MKNSFAPKFKENKTSHPSVNLEQLTGYLGYHIRQAQIGVFKDLSGSLRHLNITPGEFSLLTSVKNNKGVCQMQLANVYDIDKSTLSHSVKRMVRRGLIVRRRLKDDRRYYGLRLTPAGERLLGRVTKIVEAQEDLMYGVLASGEKKNLLNMLSRISNMFEKTGRNKI